MKKTLGLLAAASLCSAGAASLPTTAQAHLVPAAAPAAASSSVRIGDDYFASKTLRIKRGTTVVWRWVGDDDHNVVGKGFRSPTKSSGTFRRKFTKRGTFRYVCSLHADKMRGTIIVR